MFTPATRLCERRGPRTRRTPTAMSLFCKFASPRCKTRVGPFGCGCRGDHRQHRELSRRDERDSAEKRMNRLGTVIAARLALAELLGVCTTFSPRAEARHQ